MIAKRSTTLADLFDADETAWLEAMADLVSRRQVDELDLDHLQEYLADMAKRDRREVKSRLTVLAAHVLKWLHQKKNRTRGWRQTIVSQRQELEDVLTSKALRNHAEAILEEAYANAVEQAAAQTGLAEEAFPAECPWTLEQLLSPEMLGD